MSVSGRNFRDKESREFIKMRVGLHIGKVDWSEDSINLGKTLEEIARTADQSPKCHLSLF